MLVTCSAGPIEAIAAGAGAAGAGVPVTFSQNNLNLNVGNVGFHPGKSIGRGDQIVLFKPHQNGWQVRLYNLPPGTKAQCAQLKTDSDFG